MTKPTTKATDGLVYSSEHGRMCSGCRQPVAQCTCHRSAAAARSGGDGVARVWRETKGRKGKGVTRIVGLPVDDQELRRLAKALKQRCGSGGTVKDGVIEIQGDHRDIVLEALQEEGHPAKRAGG